MKKIICIAVVLTLAAASYAQTAAEVKGLIEKVNDSW